KDQTLRAWDATTGKPLGAPIKFDSEIMGLSFQPNGGQLSAASSDETVWVWDWDRSRWPFAAPAHRLAGHHTGVWTVAYSPDSRWLLAGAEAGVLLPGSATGARLAPLRGPEGRVRSLSFSADGELLAAGAYTRPAVIWSIPAIRTALTEMGLDW